MKIFNAAGSIYPNKFVGLFIILACCFFAPAGGALADSPEIGLETPATGFVYVVQPGDTLILIALRHNLNPIEIVLANHLANPNLIFPGQELILPDVLAPDSPAPQTASPPTENEAAAPKIHIVQPGESVSAIAWSHGVSINHLVLLNRLSNPDLLQSGQLLQIPTDSPAPPGPLNPPFAAITVSEPDIIQGRTLVIKVTLSEPATLNGMFEARPLFFHRSGGGQYWTLIPIHALLAPNIYPILLEATLPNGQKTTRYENITVLEGPYGQENIQLDSNRTALLDVELIQIEREKLLNIWSQLSLRPQWEGPFWYPVAADTLRITSYFGTRRHYNNSDELSFHGGTDFGGGTGTPIYTPAAGTVVLAEPLTVRGNAVVIDHGMGLFSNYWHQSQIAVIEGQQVQPGDLIGYIGDTGLVTGPHLHWELRLNGIAVNPLQWVQESIP